MPPSSMPLALERPASARTVSGPVRSGRRTKLLVKHLLRGEIALIDHLDIDRHRFARCFRFAIPNVSQINGAQDIESHIREIHVAPFEGKQFATTQSRRHIQKHHQTKT